jgi:hypothetical protein
MASSRQLVAPNLHYPRNSSLPLVDSLLSPSSHLVESQLLQEVKKKASLRSSTLVVITLAFSLPARAAMASGHSLVALNLRNLRNSGSLLANSLLSPSSHLVESQLLQETKETASPRSSTPAMIKSAFSLPARVAMASGRSLVAPNPKYL